jgi:hypothetical protein
MAQTRTDTALVSLIVLGALGLVGLVRAWPEPSGSVIVVASPFASRSAVDVVGHAGGQLLGAGLTRWVAVGTSPDPAFHARLLAEGALFLMAPMGPTGCTPDATTRI